MKKVVDFRQIIVLEKEEFDTSFRRHLCYSEIDDFTRKVDTFEELVALVEDDAIFNAKVETSMFTGKKTVVLYKADLYDNKRVITKKKFKPFEIKCVHLESTGKNSFNDLMELLSAEDFAEWCKDHGIQKICV